MAVLNVLVASMLVVCGCYRPDLRDCAVSCASSADCGPGQVCGDDRWCAAPPVAGRCTSPPGGTAALVDAAADGATDAAAHDDASPDGPASVSLVVQIMGRGSVSIANVGACNDTAPDHQCTFAVPGGIARQIVATGTEDEFEKWTSVACGGQTATCTFTPVAPSTTVAAKFRH